MKTRLCFLVSALLLSLFLSNCKKDPNNDPSQTTDTDTITVDIGFPVVVTTMVSEVGFDSALGGGEVTDDGGCEVTARGLCWGKHPNPGLTGDHSEDSCGMGAFVHRMTGLTEHTKYYVRAYATNAKGTSFGDDKVFTTAALTPLLKTVEVTEVESFSATVSCEVTDEGGGAVTERGVCWGLQPAPTLADATQSSGAGLGTYQCNLTDLEPNTTYYVRAYAVNSYATGYGNEVSFTTLDLPGPPVGAIEGLFSVSETQQVWFSQGNLQYQASTNTWRFADRQYEIMGSANEKISPTFEGWIDLFGWGTSGYDHGAVCYQPWSISEAYNDYNVYGYDNANLFDETGQADWGYNPIDNGGNVTNYWRTLTHGEWYYLFETRSTPSEIRFVKAQVNEMNGVILLPDDWNPATFALTNANVKEADYTGNVITAAEWEVLEGAGAVFLPAAGGRFGTSFGSEGSIGSYWSSSFGYYVGAWSLNFLSDYLDTEYIYVRHMGLSVRLVRDE